MNPSFFSTTHFVLDTGSARATDAVKPASEGARALVLGGGGSTGNAWLIGVVAGLAEAGVEVGAADMVIGTSAGATAAIQLTDADPGQLLAEALSAVPPMQEAPRGAGPGTSMPGRVPDQLARIGRIIDAAVNPIDMRRQLGAAALDLESAADGSWSGRWRATVEARLPGKQWPERPALLTAVDARTGEPVVFSRDSGIDVVDAVAASCASSLPYAIGPDRFIDGGYRRSSENADLAGGYKKVLVLSPLGGKSLQPPAWGMELATQVRELRAAGSRVETIMPGRDAEQLFGANAMNLSMRPAAARAGYEQAREISGRITEFWNRAMESTS